MKFKQEDKLKIARIIAMSLGYMDAQTKTNPSEIINAALRGIRNKPLNPEAKNILARMLSTATSAGIEYNSKIVECLTPEEKSAHNLIHAPGTVHSSNYARLRKIHLKVHEEQEYKEPTEEELNQMVNSLSDEDFLDAYDEDDFVVLDADGNVCEEVELNEVLSKIERLRSRMRMKKTAAKRERAAKIALAKHSTGKVLARRARRMAEKALKLRLVKKPLNKLSVAEKERLEARLAKMRPVVTRLAMKMTNKVRKIENERLAR